MSMEDSKGKKKIVMLLITVFLSQGMIAQGKEEVDSIFPFVTNSFWDNWYWQVGANMNLLFPYEENIGDVFPNGKSFWC